MEPALPRILPSVLCPGFTTGINSLFLFLPERGKTETWATAELMDRLREGSGGGGVMWLY